MAAYPEDEDSYVSWDKIFNKTCYLPNAVLEWRWHDTSPNSICGSANVLENNTAVIFHPKGYMATGAVLGDTPLEKNSHHYFEVQITDMIHERDMLIGIAFSNNPVSRNANRGVTALTLATRHSVGISNSGEFLKNRSFFRSCGGYGVGDVVSVRIDLWYGCAEFYVNRQNQAVAVFNLRAKNYLYPMVLSWAKNSSIKLLYSASYRGCLLSLAARKLNIQAEWTNIAPGLKKLLKKYFWLLYPDDTLTWDLSMDDAMRVSFLHDDTIRNGEAHFFEAPLPI